jgi:inward rectifier potassium channel
MPKPTFDPGLTQTFTGRIGRTINTDGSFNVRRVGGHFSDAGYFLYFMNLSWPAFLAQMPLIYIGIISVFAALYYSAGIENLQGAPAATKFQAVSSAFFFSVQTFTTVGYGHIAPASLLTSSIAAVEAMCGILSLAVATGMIFARFSRPNARLAFTTNAVIAPFQGGRGLMFRIANRRPNVLREIQVKVVLMTVDPVDGVMKRRFDQLALERDTLDVLPITWTLVHPIDEKSPLRHRTHETLDAEQAEFLVLVKAFDDTFSQTVHAQISYTAADLVWDARFKPAFSVNSEGELVLDLARLNDYEKS